MGWGRGCAAKNYYPITFVGMQKNIQCVKKFSDAMFSNAMFSDHLFKRVCPSICRPFHLYPVSPSICLSFFPPVLPSVHYHFSKTISSQKEWCQAEKHYGILIYHGCSFFPARASLHEDCCRTLCKATLDLKMIFLVSRVDARIVKKSHSWRHGKFREQF